jgi:8-oxo-dGTP pyrophosphatase MutT (NUDIX family)
MFRLKSLDTTAAAIINPQPKPQPMPAMPLVDSELSTFIANQPPGFTHVAVSAAVFHENRLLLVQRAESDSYPGHWELPGGSADPTDKSISESVARELFEETGLRMKRILTEILPPTSFVTGWGKRQKTWLKVSFVVEVAAESKLNVAREVDKMHESVQELRRQDSVIAVEAPAVKLNPEEHQKHMWISAEDVIKNRVSMPDSGALEFISMDSVSTMLEAFRMNKHIQKAEAAEALQVAGMSFVDT